MHRCATLSFALALLACGEPAGPIDSGPVDLGELPAEVAVRWPAPPVTDAEVDVRTADELTAAASRPGSLIRVRASFTERAFVRASDVAIVVDDGVALGTLLVERAHARVAIRGGRWQGIELQVPAQFFPEEEWREEWLIEDVLIDGVEVDAPDTAFSIRGRRVAIVNSRAHAARYSVWCGETHDFQSEDVVLYGNALASEGPEATVRLVQVLRSVTVDNRLSNPLKHNYRVHGRSDLNYAARNTLIGTGAMLGTLPGDQLGREWLDDNAIHHRGPSVLVVDPAVERLVSRGNRLFSDSVDCWLCGVDGDGWDVGDNAIDAYTPPPDE